MTELIKVIRAKLHGIHVTDANLNYHGSITLDPEHCASVGIFPLEFVEIWNKNSGARISTYVILGEAGSRCCVLNGAAARTCQKGDEIIIAASQYCTSMQISKIFPKIITFNDHNEIQEMLQYKVTKNESDANGYQFAIEKSLPSRSPSNIVDSHTFEEEITIY